MTERELEDIDEKDDFDPEAVDDEWEEEEADLEVAEDFDGEADPPDEADDADDGTDDDQEDADREALDELEAEELEMLTDDEESETLVVDEVAELRAIRRAELAMEGDGPGERAQDEFLCQGCFLVLKRSQLADRGKMLCRDCAA